jgi:hypothetical protein
MRIPMRTAAMCAKICLPGKSFACDPTDVGLANQFLDCGRALFGNRAAETRSKVTVTNLQSRKIASNIKVGRALAASGTVVCHAYAAVLGQPLSQQ